MTYFYTYKITLLKGSFKGHYYFGQHTTDNLNDGYAGSGTIIRSYYKKYGKVESETYNKEIIQFYNDSKELNEAEYELIGDKYNSDDMCLNLKSGGDKMTLSKISINKMSNSLKGHTAWNKGKQHSDETKQKISEASKGRIISDETKQKLSESLIGKNKGRTHSEESKKHMSEAHKGKPSSRKGKHHTEEAKQKMRINLGKTWIIDETTGKRKWIEK